MRLDDGPAEVDLSPEEFLTHFLPGALDFDPSGVEKVIESMRDTFVEEEDESQRLERLVSWVIF